MKEAYLKKRQELLNKAKGLIEEGKIAEAKQVREEIENLDADFENRTKELANLAALQDKPPAITDIASKSVPVAGAKPFAAGNAGDEVKNETEIYRAAFAKHLMAIPQNKQEAEVFDRINTEFRNTVQTAATHTVLVPETVKNQIWEQIGESHPILNDLEMTFVQGDLTILKETATGDDGDWYDEDDEVGEDDTGFGELNLTGCELAKDITVSWKLKKMSIDAFLAYVIRKIAKKMGNALAKAVINGLGKPSEEDTFKAQPYGIATALQAEAATPQVVTYTTAAPVDYDKMTDVMAKLKSGYLSGAAFYAKNTVIWGVLAKIKNDNGVPMFVPDVSAGGVGRLFGVPVKEEDGVAADQILLANVKEGYALNVNENMTMYQEEHVKQRKTDYMGYAIVDGNVITTQAFVLLKKAG